MTNLALILFRTDQSADASEPGLEEALTQAFGLSGGGYLRVLPTLGRWDNLAFCSSDADRTATDWVNLIPSFASFKKMDVQYALAPAAEVKEFRTALQWGESPLLALMYLRVRDDLLLAHGARALQDIDARLRGACGEVTSLVAQTSGWPDFGVLLLGDNIEKVVAAAEKAWSIQAMALGQVSDPERAWLLSGSDAAQPLFSRSFTVVAYMPDKLREVTGSVHAPCVHLRTRVGSDADIRDVMKGLPVPGVVTGLSVRLGADDAAIEFSAPEPGSDVHVLAQDLLPWYTEKLLPALRPYIHASELRFGVSPTARIACAPDPQPLRKVSFPEQAIERWCQNREVRPLAGALQSISRMVNWGMSHDALYRSLADLYLHTRALADEMHNPDWWPEDVPDLTPADKGRVSQLASLFSEAIVQRMQGSYYDMIADTPEVVLELSANMSRTMLCFWAIQHVILRAVAVFAHARPAAYWLASKEGEIGACDAVGDTFVFRISSSFLFDFPEGLYAAGHEIGHAVFAMLAPVINEAQAQGRELPPWASYLADLPATGLRQIVTDIFAELFADAFACVILLDGDAERMQQSLGTSVTAWVDAGNDEAVLQVGLRMLFAQWVRDAFGGRPASTQFDHKAPLSMPTPATDHEAEAYTETEGATMARCREAHGSNGYLLIERALPLARRLGLLRPATFVAYASLVRYVVSIARAIDESTAVPEALRADVRWLGRVLRELRSNDPARLHVASEQLYDQAMRLLAQSLRAHLSA